MEEVEGIGDATEEMGCSMGMMAHLKVEAVENSMETMAHLKAMEMEELGDKEYLEAEGMG